MQESLGFGHFLTQADAVAKSILLLMLVMSVSTWYLIITKSVRNFLSRRASGRFLRFFWNAPDLGVVAAHLRAHRPDEPFSHLVRHGLRAAEQQASQAEGLRGAVEGFLADFRAA
jgi:biopolymer transport protein ExbB